MPQAREFDEFTYDIKARFLFEATGAVVITRVTVSQDAFQVPQLPVAPTTLLMRHRSMLSSSLAHFTLGAGK